MTNPLTKKVPSNHSFYILLILTATAGLILWVTFNGYDQIDPQTAHAAQTVQSTTKATNVAVQPNSALNGHSMHVTGFSSVECKTTWCKANAGKPRGNQVALNPKFGKGWTKVYIPAFDKFYTVIGTTDEKTDLDIWFGDDQGTAKTINTTLLVNLIK